MGNTPDLFAWLCNVVFILASLYYYHSYLTNGKEKSFAAKVGMFFVCIFCGLIMTVVIMSFLKSISWLLPLAIIVFIAYIFT